MRSFTRVLGLALIAGGLCCGAQAAPATAACLGFSGTADGFDQETAVSRAQAAVAQAITDYRTQRKLPATAVTAMKAKPQPYWRDSVAAELFYKPDIVKANSYTVCWHGVVSPYVCTSGAKACW
jgi:hypothetical protein